MESLPATVTKASAGAATLRRGLPEEIVIWEILLRLPPKSLLRCRAVCCAWRRATSTRPFLEAHHGRQPCLPIVCCSENRDAGYEDIMAFDHRAADAQLKPVVRLEDSFRPETSCDGLLVLSRRGMTDISYSVCNPATRQHAPLSQLSGFSLQGMYKHHPTNEYRLLLRQTPAHQIRFYIFALGSDQPPRYIVGSDARMSGYLYTPALVRDSLHWYPEQYESGSHVVNVFDTTSESFRQMSAPAFPVESYIFEMDDTLSIYSCSDAMKTVDIWVLQNYESEVWAHKYNVKLSYAEIKGQIGWLDENWDISVEFVDGDVVLLVSHGGWMFYVDIDGKLVENFHRDGQEVYTCELRLRQTLVQHTFFTRLEGYAVNASPFI